jgi:hypothetical protein
MRGEAIPPSALAPSSGPASHSSLSLASPLKDSPVPAQLASLSLHTELAPTATMNASPAEIAPNSPLEHALINVVLPYTPHLLIPVHPQRLLALITLPPTDPRRPHPALLYILFAEAVRILENHKPRPELPRAPATLFPQNFSPPMPSTTTEPSYILTHVQGASLSLLERARTELDHGIRTVDRPFDLVRAAIGISRYLYSLGRFVEGWNIPVARLLVSCGLHRMTGNIVRPDNAPVEFLPQPYPPAHAYAQPLAATPYPVLRMRPVIVPPARDEIEMAERNLTFWAAKSSDWAAGLGWGWTTGMADDECTTEWPWGWGSVEVSDSPESANSRSNPRMVRVGAFKTCTMRRRRCTRVLSPTPRSRLRPSRRVWCTEPASESRAVTSLTPVSSTFPNHLSLCFAPTGGSRPHTSPHLPRFKRYNPPSSFSASASRLHLRIPRVLGTTVSLTRGGSCCI